MNKTRAGIAIALLAAACSADDDASSSAGGSSGGATGSPTTAESTSATTSAGMTTMDSADATGSDGTADTAAIDDSTGAELECAPGQARVTGTITPSELFGPQMTGVIEPLVLVPIDFVVCFTLGDDLERDPLYALHVAQDGTIAFDAPAALPPEMLESFASLPDVTIGLAWIEGDRSLDFTFYARGAAVPAWWTLQGNGQAAGGPDGDGQIVAMPAMLDAYGYLQRTDASDTVTDEARGSVAIAFTP